MKTQITIIRFPGSNCDQDIAEAFSRGFGLSTQFVWHTETKLPKSSAVVIPGGFSFGDYLRSGALAAHSPIMQSVKTFALGGGPVLGICNGFQILTESHLLPGALLKNLNRRFICRFVTLETSHGSSEYHKQLGGKKIRMPIAHGEGRYYIDETGYRQLADHGQIAFRYQKEDNPNGSLGDIAGVVSKSGKIMGLMPHPERATDEVLGGSGRGSQDGQLVLKAFLDTAV